MKNLFKKIFSEDIDLVSLSMKHLDHFWEYSKDKRLYEFLEYKPLLKKSEGKLYLKKLIKRSNKKDAHWWFIYHKNDKKIIGTIGILNINFRKKNAELSYALSPVYWGKGIFSKALKILLKRLFEDNFNEVYAITHEKNKRSIKALLRSGFKKSRIIKKGLFQLDGIIYDHAVLVFSLFKIDYNSTQEIINKKIINDKIQKKLKSKI